MPWALREPRGARLHNTDGLAPGVTVVALERYATPAPLRLAERARFVGTRGGGPPVQRTAHGPFLFPNFKHMQQDKRCLRQDKFDPLFIMKACYSSRMYAPKSAINLYYFRLFTIRTGLRLLLTILLMLDTMSQTITIPIGT
jgi:hypothetical protein